MKDEVLDEIKNIFILEGDYKRIKYILNKVSNYYSIYELNLMQFLMQRQKENIKKEEKI